MKKRVFIVHGWGGSPQDDWLPWLKKELEARDISVMTPSMPDTENPKIRTWIPCLSEAVGNINENTFFVGHSIGCQTILRYLETLPLNQKAGGAVFIAGWMHLVKDLDAEEQKIAKPWLESKINFKKVKKQLNKLICVFSTNDPFVPLEDERLFAKELNAKTIIQKNKGHFRGGEDGATQLPIALSSLSEIIS